MDLGLLIGGMAIADAISKTGRSESTTGGIIKCGSGPCKLDKYKEYFQTLTEEEQKKEIKTNKALALYNLLGKEKYIEHLERQSDFSNSKNYIYRNGPEAFNESILLKKRIEELEKENKALKEERPKTYIRRK